MMIPGTTRFRVSWDMQRHVAALVAGSFFAFSLSALKQRKKILKEFDTVTKEFHLSFNFAKIGN